jgi:hypothetical protein
MKLQLTNGFKPQLPQISRIMQYLSLEFKRDRIPPKEIEDNLGMSELLVKFLSSTAVAYGLMEPRTFTLTNLGKTISKNDPFFEAVETLWIIHYIISSNPDWVVWYRMINQVIPMNDTISLELAIPYFNDLSNNYSKQTMQEGLAKEINAIFWVYTESELAKLGILNSVENNLYSKGTPIEIPYLAFLFCILHYCELHSISATAITKDEIIRTQDSPGMVLNIPEYQIRALLEKLHDTDTIRLEQLGDLDQVRFSEGLTKEKVLQRIYEA